MLFSISTRGAFFTFLFLNLLILRFYILLFLISTVEFSFWRSPRLKRLQVSFVWRSTEAPATTNNSYVSFFAFFLYDLSLILDRIMLTCLEINRGPSYHKQFLCFSLFLSLCLFLFVFVFLQLFSCVRSNSSF